MLSTAVAVLYNMIHSLRTMHANSNARSPRFGRRIQMKTRLKHQTLMHMCQGIAHPVETEDPYHRLQEGIK